MLNRPFRPFSSVTNNVVDQKFQNSTPAFINGQNVILSEEQHQKSLNVLAVSITGAPGSNVTTGNPYNLRTNGVIERRFPMQPTATNLALPCQENSPNNVTLTLNQSNNQPYTSFNEATTNATVLTPSDVMDLMHLQLRLNEPYYFNFHHTLTISDLGNFPAVRPLIYYPNLFQLKCQNNELEAKTRNVKFDNAEIPHRACLVDLSLRSGKLL